MKTIHSLCILLALVSILSGCATSTSSSYSSGMSYGGGNYSARLPQTISSNQKTILVDPNVHAWGAYQGGNLVKAGLATSGGAWCDDVKRPCKTVAGTFHIYKLGSFECRSKTYPIGKGGSLMPYCMFFSGGYSLHGSSEMAEANISHGCVRMTVPDAEWVRHDFASVGTQVIVRPY